MRIDEIISFSEPFDGNKRILTKYWLNYFQMSRVPIWLPINNARQIMSLITSPQATRFIYTNRSHLSNCSSCHVLPILQTLYAHTFFNKISQSFVTFPLLWVLSLWRCLDSTLTAFVFDAILEVGKPRGHGNKFCNFPRVEVSCQSRSDLTWSWSDLFPIVNSYENMQFSVFWQPQ